ncbi:MAG: hypothetical protein JWQ23_390 [Herminiimonas sp.]|jgi:TRAP-type C4-dicarboxylate transport system permease small subunit|nr:hypothetical protein [Herminiimonas sp.]
MLTRLNDRVTQALLIAAAVLAFMLCFLVVADVIGRVAFNSPVKGTPEIVSTCIVIICYLQAGYAIRSGGMLNVDVFVNKLPLRGQSFLGIIGALAGAAFFAFICWGSIETAIHAWTTNEFEGEGALRVPAWPTRFAIVLGTALATTSYLLMTAQNISLFRAGEAPVQSGSSH